MPRPFSEEKRQLWKDNILEQRESGLSIASWCRKNNVTHIAFHYWKKKLFPKTNLIRSDFSEIPNTEDRAYKASNRSGIILEHGGVFVHLEKHFDPSALKQCLEILGDVKC